MIKKSKLFLLISVFILSLSSCTFSLTGTTSESTSKTSEETSDLEPSIEEDSTEDSTSSSESTSEDTSTSTSEDTSEDSSSSSSDSTSEDTGEDPNTSENTGEDDSSSSSSSDTSGSGDVEEPPEEDEDDNYPIYRSYSYAFVNTDFGNLTGDSFTRNGLTWTYDAFDSNVSVNKDSSGRGVQIGTGTNPQSTPWTLSTDFNETVQLNSVRVYLYSSTSSGLTVHYDISFDGESLTQDDFHSSNASDVHYAEVLDVAYEGNKLDISINAKNNTAFYLEAVVLSIHTTSESKLRLSLSDGYIPDDYQETSGGGLVLDPGEEPDNAEEYTWYQTYAHNFTLNNNSNPDGDLNANGGEFTAGGLTWTYDEATYMGNDGQFGRGIQIGSSSNPQYEDWTITTVFPETVLIMDIAFYLYTTTSGLAHYKVDLDGQTLGESDFSTSSTKITGVYLAEFNELEYWGTTISLSLKTLAAEGFFLKAVSINCYTYSQSNIVLEAEEIGTGEYEPAPVVPGENDVLATKYDQTDPDQYYKDYDLTLTGDDLAEELQKACEVKTRYTYGDIRHMLPYSDEDPNNEGYMFGFYDGDELPAYWDAASYDREHVWACSHMRLNTDDPDNDYRPDNSSVGHYSDLHNLRICCKPTNVYKSDKYFGEDNTSVYFYPNETNPERLGSGSHSWNGDRTGDHRGDSARICLYMYVMYDELDLDNGFTTTEGVYNTFGDLDCCIRWCLEDLPDEFETQRNNRIEEYQGNRNPFIDHPELVKQLFPDFDYSAYGL